MFKFTIDHNLLLSYLLLRVPLFNRKHVLLRRIHQEVRFSHLDSILMRMDCGDGKGLNKRFKNLTGLSFFDFLSSYLGN